MGVAANDPDNTELRDIPAVSDAINAFPEKAALCLAYSTADGPNKRYWEKKWTSAVQRYTYQHRESKTLDGIYNLLTSLGYEMSDEEKQMQNGNHEVFKTEEE